MFIKVLQIIAAITTILTGSVQFNWISLIVEIVFGIILGLPA